MNVTLHLVAQLYFEKSSVSSPIILSRFTTKATIIVFSHKTITSGKNALVGPDVKEDIFCKKLLRPSNQFRV